MHSVPGFSARPYRTLLCVLVAAAAWLALGATMARADSFAVTNTGDSGPGSLRAAIDGANTAGGSNTITVSATGTITLVTALPALTSNIDLQGPGAGQLTVDGAGTVRIFSIAPGATVLISGLTANNGNSTGAGNGGAILNAGTLALTRVKVSNSTSPAMGGGIENDAGGTMTIQDSTVSDNTAARYGGGVEVSSGTVTATHVIVSGNKALLSNNGNGGGIDVTSGTLNLFDSTVSNNTSAGNAGGLRVEGKADVQRDTFTGNTANGGFAGGIGVTSSGEEEFVTTGTLMLTNSTVSGNTASANGGGVGGFGDVTVKSSTIASNTAPTGANVVAEAGGTTTLQNTIVADPLLPLVADPLLPLVADLLLPLGGAATNCATNGGTLTSNGFNLEDDADGSCKFTNTGDKKGIDPKLGPLQDNGGPTSTRALLSGSPAIDAGINTGCPATDQRGVARPAGGVCDIGAYERAVAATNPGRGHAPAAPPPAPPAPPPTGPTGPAACERRAISLVRADVRGGDVVLKGLVGSRGYGKDVQIYEDSGRGAGAGEFKQVQTVQASASGTFEAKVPKPSRRDFATTRYRASSLGTTSAVVKLPQALHSTSVRENAGKITVGGQIDSGLVGGRSRVTIEQLVCGQYRTVGSAKPTPGGRYSVTFSTPTLGKESYYRARALVRTKPGSDTYRVQYARAIAMTVTAQTGRLHR